MEYGLDYLSAHLQKRGYDLIQFENEASSPTFIRETGEINNVTIPRKCYRKDVHIGDVVIGTYSGGQFGFAPIVIREDLIVTRVDIKCDIYNWEGIEDGRTAQAYARYIYRLVRNFLSSKGRRVQSIESETVSRNPLEPQTFTLGARGSEWQLRIYTKNSDPKPLVRFEWQLRKDLARQVWSIISPNIYSQKLLEGSFKAVESEVLTDGILQIPFGQSDFLVKRTTKIDASNRERWIRTQVLSACLAEFKESGINLPELLLSDFNKHFATIRDGNIEMDNLNRRLKAERLFIED